MEGKRILETLDFSANSSVPFNYRYIETQFSEDMISVMLIQKIVAVKDYNTSEFVVTQHYKPISKIALVPVGLARE